MNYKKIKLFAVALIMGATVVGTQSCSDDDKTGDVKVTGITVEPTSQTLLVDGTYTLKATVFPAGADQSVRWDSNDTDVATVDDNGVVKALTTGTANIVVTSVANSEKTATCVITVKESFSVSLGATLQIPTGTTCTLVAKITPISDTPSTVTWTSSDDAVATVAGGVVTGVAAGTVTITATLDNGASDECTVTVVAVARESLVGWWIFEDETDPAKATVGEDLEPDGNFTVIEGPNGTKAVKPETDAYYTVYHNIGASGGGEYTNEYTLMMDIRGSAAEFANWILVFDNNAMPLWINADGKIGYASLGGYSTTGLTADTWHRVVIAARLTEQSFKVYIDGTLVFTATENNDVDGTVSLDTDKLYIGYAGEYAGPELAGVYMWSVQLTDEQVSELGSLN